MTLSEHGQVLTDAGDKADRLKVTEDCSLLIEKVSSHDAGVYDCRQLDREEEQHDEDFAVLLSVVTSECLHPNLLYLYLQSGPCKDLSSPRPLIIS